MTITAVPPQHGTTEYGKRTLERKLDELTEKDQAGVTDPRHDFYTTALSLGRLVGLHHLTYEYAESVLMSFANALPAKKASRRYDWKRAIRDGLVKGMSNPVAPMSEATITDAADAIMFIVDWWKSIDQADFQKTRGSSMLRVHAGAALRAMAVGCTDLRISQRDLAEAAGLSHRTVAPMMKPGGPVEQLGYMKAVDRVKPGIEDQDGMTSNTYRFILKRCSLHHSSAGQHSSPTVVQRTALLEPPSANAFHGLHNDWRILCLLHPDEDTTVAEMVEVTGLTPSTVRAVFRRLAENELVVRVDRFHWRRTLTEVDTEAPDRNGMDWQAARRRLHLKDREGYHAWQAERRAARDRRWARRIAENRRQLGLENVPCWDEDGQVIELFEHRPPATVDPLTGEIVDAPPLDAVARLILSLNPGDIVFPHAPGRELYAIPGCGATTPPIVNRSTIRVLSCSREHQGHQVVAA